MLYESLYMGFVVFGAPPFWAWCRRFSSISPQPSNTISSDKTSFESYFINLWKFTVMCSVFVMTTTIIFFNQKTIIARLTLIYSCAGLHHHFAFLSECLYTYNGETGITTGAGFLLGRSPWRLNDFLFVIVTRKG